MSFFGKFKAVVAAVVLATGVSAFAGGNQLNQLLTANAPVQANAGQWFAGGSFQYGDNDLGSAWQIKGFGAYGVTNELSIVGTLPILNVDADQGGSETGIGDIIVGAQYKLGQWIKPETFGQVNGSLTINLPTGDDEKGLGSGEIGFQPTLVAAKDFGAVGSGNMYGYAEIGAHLESRNSAFILSATPAWSPNEQWVALLELNLVAGRATTFVFVPGAVYRGVKNMELGAGLTFGAGDDSIAKPDWGLVVKATYIP